MKGDDDKIIIVFRGEGRRGGGRRMFFLFLLPRSFVSPHWLFFCILYLFAYADSNFHFNKFSMNYTTIVCYGQHSVRMFLHFTHLNHLPPWVSVNLIKVLYLNAKSVGYVYISNSWLTLFFSYYYYYYPTIPHFSYLFSTFKILQKKISLEFFKMAFWPFSKKKKV